MDISVILSSKPHNEHYLNRYIKFIKSCLAQKFHENQKREIHHICPKAKDLFYEYKSFKAFPWNKCVMTPRQHYVAHWMLWKLYGNSQSRAFWKFNHSKRQRLSSRTYEMIKNDFSINQSILMKGKPKSVEHAQKLRDHLAANTNSIEQRLRSKDRMSGRTVSLNEREKIAAGVSAFVSQTIWITNGLECKRILKSDLIPDSWKQGRIISKEHKLKLLKARGL